MLYIGFKTQFFEMLFAGGQPLSGNIKAASVCYKEWAGLAATTLKDTSYTLEPASSSSLTLYFLN